MCKIRIELRGYFQNIADELRERIFQLAADKEYGSSISVRIYLVEIVDAQGDQQPFIKLLNNEDDSVQELLDVLRNMNEKIEHCTSEGSLVASYNR